MEWQQLLYFKETAEREHYLQAAQALAISQPALSRSIAKLEQELGAPLFEKKGRGVMLSRYGKSFYKRVKTILSEMDLAQEEIKRMLDPAWGKITLGFMKSQGLVNVPRVLKQFKSQYPSIEFSLVQGSTEELIRLLEKGELDICICNVVPASSNVTWESLWKDELYAYLPRTHELAEETELSLRELEQESFLVIKPGYSSRVLFDQIVEAYQLRPSIAFESEDMMTVLGFVAAEQGITLLPYLENVAVQNVVCIPIIEPTDRQIGVAVRKNGQLPPASAYFIELLKSLS